MLLEINTLNFTEIFWFLQTTLHIQVYNAHVKLSFQDKISGSCPRNLRNSRLLKKRGTVIDKDFGVICVLKKFICGIFDKRGDWEIFGIAIEIPVRVIRPHEIIFPNEKLCLMPVLNGLSLCLLDFELDTPPQNSEKGGVYRRQREGSGAFVLKRLVDEG